MRSAFVMLILASITIVSPSVAQWRKIADFPGHDDDPTNIHDQIITCVYFLDLLGPPRIGFVGTESSLYKTTDGGKSWYGVWDSGWSRDSYFVTDICFKDSLTGWFTVFGSHEGLFQTTDGGETWVALKAAGLDASGALGISYMEGTNRLFLSPADYVPMQSSTDLGTSWDTVGPWVGETILSTSTPYAAVTSAALLLDTGILQYGGNGGTAVFDLITYDGGITWDSVRLLASEVGAWSGVILSVPNSPTCFESDGLRIVIRRSDDYGRTWRVLKDFGPVADTNGNPIPDPAPRGTGVIKGIPSRLYISTDSGFYASTDSGITWMTEGGPQTWYSAFFAAHGVTIAGGVSAPNGGIAQGSGLWEEIWPQSGVTPVLPSPAPEFGLFPNPTRGTATILGAAEPITVTNVLGEVVAGSGNRAPGTGEAQLDLSKLPAGMYFIRLTGPDGRATVSRVVKE